MCSAVYLKNRDDRWDAVAVAAAEVGMLFCVDRCSITGPLWARKAWGVWWTWDPRLTSTLLEAMIFFAYLVLRSFGALGEVEKRFAAGLAIVGVLDIPIIKLQRAALARHAPDRGHRQGRRHRTPTWCRRCAVSSCCSSCWRSC